MSTSLEQEKYFSAVVSLTPMGNQRFPGTGGATVRPAGPIAASSSNTSLTSIDSLLLCHAVVGDLLPGGDLSASDSLLRGRSGASPFARAVSNLRSGGVKAKCKHWLGFYSVSLVIPLSFLSFFMFKIFLSYTKQFSKFKKKSFSQFLLFKICLSHSEQYW